MYNSRTKSTLLPCSAARKTNNFPSSLSLVAVRKNMSSFISLCLRSVHSLLSFRFWGGSSYLTAIHLHFISFVSFHPPQHPTASGKTHFHFASSIHSVSPKPLSNAIPMVYFSYCGESTPTSAFQAER